MVRRFRLTSDVTRAFLALLAGLLAVAVVTVIAPIAPSGLRLPQGWARLAVFVMVMFSSYVALTLVAFARLEPESLARVIRETEARRIGHSPTTFT